MDFTSGRFDSNKTCGGGFVVDGRLVSFNNYFFKSKIIFKNLLLPNYLNSTESWDEENIITVWN
jgi:hypothetical protein